VRVIELVKTGSLCRPTGKGKTTGKVSLLCRQFVREDAKLRYAP
jgi:hypothetical protein